MRLHTAPELRRYAPGRFLVRDLDAGSSLRTLIGRAVPYDTTTNVGWYLENFAPGAFNKSIEEAARNLPLLRWHDNNEIPIGQAVAWTSQPDGLWGEWSLDGSDEAQQAARAAQDGRLASLSVGFLPMQSRWTFADDWDPDSVDQMDTVTRVEARLLETSLTPTPAYADAVVTEVRSAALHTAEAPHRRRRAGAYRQVDAYRELDVRPPARVRADLAELAALRGSIRPTQEIRTAACERR